MLTNEAKQRACDLANAASDLYAPVKDAYVYTVKRWGNFGPPMTALAQHIQDVSERLTAYFDKGECCLAEENALYDFILPKPAPDPLVEALEKVSGELTSQAYADAIREHLAKSGHEVAPIVEAG